MNHKKTDKNHIKKQFDVKKFVYNKDYFKYYPYYNPIIHYKYNVLISNYSSNIFD